MPLIQPGQGSIPSKGDMALAGMGDALESFVNSYKSEKDKAQDRADKQAEFKQKQEELDANRENTKLMRQATLWQSLTEKATMAAQRQGLQWGTDDYNKFIKQQLAMGVGFPDGKVDIDKVQDVYGDSAASYFQTAASGGNSQRVAADQPGTPTGNAMKAAQAQTQTGNYLPTIQAVLASGGLASLLPGVRQGVGGALQKGWAAANSPLGKAANPLAGDMSGMASLDLLGPLAGVAGAGAAGWGAGRALGGMNVGGQTIDQRVQQSILPLLTQAQGQQPQANTLNPAVLAYLSQQANQLPQGQQQ